MISGQAMAVLQAGVCVRRISADDLYRACFLQYEQTSGVYGSHAAGQVTSFTVDAEVMSLGAETVT